MFLRTLLFPHEKNQCDELNPSNLSNVPCPVISCIAMKKGLLIDDLQSTMATGHSLWTGAFHMFGGKKTYENQAGATFDCWG